MAKLAADSEKYEAIFDNNLNCIYMHDLSGNFRGANDAALSFVGYCREEILSLTHTIYMWLILLLMKLKKWFSEVFH